MVKKDIYILVLTIITLAILVACSQPSQPQKPAEVKTVKYGVVCVQSGPIAFMGLGILRAVQLATSNINKNGTTGLGPGLKVGDQAYKIEVVSYDDGFDPAKSVAGYRQLVEMHGVKVIQGPMGCPCALAAMKINEELGVIIAPFCASDNTRKMGDKLYIQERMPVQHYALPLAKAAWDRGYRTVCIVSDLADSWSGMSKEFKNQFEKLGGQVPALEIVDMSKTTDYHSIMTNFKSKNPDIIFVVMYDEPIALAVSHAFEVGYNGKFMFPSEMGPKTEQKIGLDKLDGSLVQSHEWTLYRKYPDMDKKGAVTNVLRQWKEAYNETPAQTAVPAWDTCYMLARAMEIAGTVTDPYAIRAACPKALQEGKLPQLIPATDMLDNGLPYGAFENLCVIKDGKYNVIVDKLIVPRSVLE